MESVHRDPQHTSEVEHDHEESRKFENSFQSIMKESTDLGKANSMIKFLRRQMGFFAMAQDMVQKFDSELDRLYKLKQASPQTEINVGILEKYQFQLNIAREMTERNLHELQYIYERLLTEANQSKSALSTASSLALKSLKSFFEENWDRQDAKPALFSLALEFQDVNKKVQSSLSDVRDVPDFNRIIGISPSEREAVFKSSTKWLKQQLQLHVDPTVTKEWQRTFKARPFLPNRSMDKRKPQTADIYPDAGPNGTINGSRFSKGVWSLTYDDGPHRSRTEAISKALHEAGYIPTFFWLAKNMKAYPQVVDKTATVYGFRRASHSYSHANLPTLSDSGLKREIDDASDVFAGVVGQRPTLFRCPYGACGPQGGRIRQRIANNHMVHVMWNVDSLDWQDKNPRSIFERVRKQMEISGRGIVLFHDIHEQTVEATKLLIPYLKAKSEWRVLPLDEIIQMETGKEYATP